MDEKDIAKRLEEHLDNPTAGSNVVDFELRKIVALLGLSVLKLNDSSTRLARVNIRLTWANVCFSVVLIAIGIIQVILMVRGH